MLQGKRRSHRRWWLSRRFSLYDSKFVSGDFKGKAFEFKVINNTEPGWSFSITAGIAMEYGWGVYNPMEIGVSLLAGEPYSFHVGQTLNIGDPVRIYSAFNLQEVNLSNILPRLSNIELNNVWNETLGTKLKRLILGDGINENTILTTISSLARAKRIEYLDIRGCKGITTMDLSQNLYLDTLLAKGSGLTNVTLAKGAPVKVLSLPDTMQVVRLEQLISLPISGVTFENNGANIRSLTIMNCPELSTAISFPLFWLDNKVADDADSTLYMDNVNWVNVEPDDFLKICEAKVNGVAVTLKGKVKLTTSSHEIIDTITEAFGSSVFKPTNELYVNAPDAIYLAGPDSILEGESAQFTAVVFSDYLGTVTYSILDGSRSGTSIDSRTGYLTSKETGYSTSTLTIRAIHRPTQGSSVYADKSFKVIQRTYPKNITINGNSNPSEEVNIYTWKSSTAGINGECIAEWELAGDITEYLAIDYSDNEKCRVVPLKIATDSINGTLKVTIKKKYNGSVVSSYTKNLQLLNPEILMTNVTNPEVMAIMYANGLAANETYMTKVEASLVTDSDLQPEGLLTSIFYIKTIKTFNEFEYFTGVTVCPNFGGNNLISIKFPPSLIQIPYMTLYGHPLVRIDIPEGTTLVNLPYCEKLVEVNLSSTVKQLCLDNCISLEKVELPEGLEELLDYALRNTAITEITLPESLVKIGNAVFNETKIERLTIPKNVRTFNYFSTQFNGGVLKELHIESNYMGWFNVPTSETNALNGLEVFTIPELDDYKMIDGILYSKSSLDYYEIRWIFNYTGNENIFTFPKFNFPIYVKSISIYNPREKGKMDNIKKVVLLSNVYLGSKDSCPNMQELFVNSKEWFFGDDSNLYIDEQGLIRLKENSEIAGISPQCLSEVTINESMEFYLTSKIFRYSKVRKLTVSGLSVIPSYFLSQSEIEILEIKNVNEPVSFGISALSYCKKLRTVIFPDTVEYIILNDGYTFQECSLLANIDVPVKLMNSNGKSFYNCFALKEISIHPDSSKFGQYEFWGCIALKNIRLPISVALNAYRMFGSSENSYTGRNTYNTGENMLYVPSGATGYDTGEWLTLLDPEKCGFTISYTL